jgi:transcriptional regulator with XRE-family HTH domain
MITGRQIRAARGLLRWRVEDLAIATGLTREAITRIEDDQVQPRATSLSKIREGFEKEGIEFLDNQGVRFRPSDVEVFRGVDGFARFHDLVYEHINQNGGQVCICGSSSDEFAKFRKNPSIHRGRMADLVKERKDISVRVLAAEGDTNFGSAAYASYRWQPREYFPPTAFYAFGEYLGLISFESDNPPHIVLIRSSVIAASYRKSFDFAWQNAKEPTKGSV